MRKCLGIYIESNIIKYALVSENHNEMKIEAFGIRFFENFSSELSKVIEETYSFNTPISINIANEKYLYFDVFALLNKKDIEKTIQTEFETYCDENKYNVNAFVEKHTLMPKKDDDQKIRVIDAYINKIELDRQTEPFKKYRLSFATPISIAIANIARLNKKENQIIVNMEESTIITTIYDNQIYNIDTLEIGSREVLSNINKLENSYSKAYEICKNTTIYTADVDETSEEQPYLQYIVPVIYKIVQEIQGIVANTATNFKTIYLTGTLASINNIDLYFQEFFTNVECKILKPNIVDETVTKINIKDYIEANSAIALATAGLGRGLQEFNFGQLEASSKLAKFLTIQLPNGKEIVPKTNFKLNKDFKDPLSNGELRIVRSIVAVLLILIIFIAFSKLLSIQMLEKEDEINNSILSQNAQITAANSDKSSLDSKNQKYQQLISDMKKTNERLSDIASSRNSIPNLLNQIMYVIPERVQLISIDNASDKNITIQAQSSDYEQIGIFVATLRTKGILKNVASSKGTKSNGIITVTIEGELP